MILPSKHISIDRSLLGVGAQILDLLNRPKTMSELWNEVRTANSDDEGHSTIGYKWYVLSLDFLYMIDAVEFKKGVLMKRKRK